MVKVPLTQKKYAIIDNIDIEIIKGHRWQAHNERGRWYAVTGIQTNKGRTTVRMHRLILSAKQGEVVDHINHNGLDNRRENIRICTTAENNRNVKKTKKKTTSIYKGVSRRPNLKNKPFEAYISINKKRKHLGFFKTEIEAARAYNKAVKKEYGVFCLLNKV